MKPSASNSDLRPGEQSARQTPRLLITAGPTHEPIDQVRYIANRSSGRMGLALAASATRRGYPTTLLLGPTSLSPSDPSSLHVLRFQTTAELQQLLQQHWPESDVLIMAAAVADYRPAVGGSPLKLRRSEGEIQLQLEPTPDLLAELGRSCRPDQTLIGFALEPHDGLYAAAREKLRRKGIHAIVANPLETMDSMTISASLILGSGQAILAPENLTKDEFADWLLERLPLIRR